MRKASWRAPTLAIIIYTVVCLMFVGDSWVRASIAREGALNEAYFGAATAQHAQERALRWYNEAFVDSGMVRGSFGQSVPAADGPFGRIQAQATGWLDGRMRVLWTLIYGGMLRISYAGLWWPLAPMFLVAAFVDGIARRKIKQTNLGLSSPERFGFAMLGIELVAMGTFALLLTPIPLPAIVPLILTAVFSFLILVAIANAHKRV